MQAITVKLQELFSYSPLIIFIVAGVIITLLILFLPLKRKKKKPNIPVAKPVAPESLASLKYKYTCILSQLEQDCLAKKISDRQAFQTLSKIVRDFVYAATGIKVQNYTLMEIHAANLPRLYELISQCYIPEFAIDTNANIFDVIKKARMVISEWN